VGADRGAGQKEDYPSYSRVSMDGTVQGKGWSVVRMRAWGASGDGWGGWVVGKEKKQKGGLSRLLGGRRRKAESKKNSSG